MGFVVVKARANDRKEAVVTVKVASEGAVREVTLARGDGFVLPSLLFAIFCLLVPFRGNFYRDTLLRREPIAPT